MAASVLSPASRSSSFSFNQPMEEAWRALQAAHHWRGYVPVRTVVYRSSSAAAAWTSEAYAPFELCMGCRCCPPGAGSGNNSSSCVDTSCCYGIDCNIPGKPFGTCAFTPRTCGCGDAAAGSNCTSAPAPPS